MTGGGGRQSDVEPQQQQQPAAQYDYPSQAGGSQMQQSSKSPCQFELKQFLECSQTQHDLTLCQGFNEALRECRINMGMLLLVVSLILGLAYKRSLQ